MAAAAGWSGGQAGPQKRSDVAVVRCCWRYVAPTATNIPYGHALLREIKLFKAMACQMCLYMPRAAHHALERNEWSFAAVTGGHCIGSVPRD